MTDERKLELLAETLEMDVKDISADMVLEDLDEWDSVAIISFIAMVDDEFNRVVRAGELKSCKTVKDLMEQMTE